MYIIFPYFILFDIHKLSEKGSTLWDPEFSGWRTELEVKLYDTFLTSR